MLSRTASRVRPPASSPEQEVRKNIDNAIRRDQLQSSFRRAIRPLASGYKGGREYLQRHHRRSIAATAGLITLAACLGGATSGIREIVKDSRDTASFQLEPMPASAPLADASMPGDPAPDPMVYASVNMEFLEKHTGDVFFGSMAAIATAEASLAGLAGLGVIVCRRRQARHQIAGDTAIPGDLAILDAMFTELPEQPSSPSMPRPDGTALYPGLEPAIYA